jgi:hypothetical protein
MHEEPKATRIHVWLAAAHINDWYREPGSRFAAGETSLAGLQLEAVSLLTELCCLETPNRELHRATTQKSLDDARAVFFRQLRDNLQKYSAAVRAILEGTKRLHRPANTLCFQDIEAGHWRAGVVYSSCREQWLLRSIALNLTAPSIRRVRNC